MKPEVQDGINFRLDILSKYISDTALCILFLILLIQIKMIKREDYVLLSEYIRKPRCYRHECGSQTTNADAARKSTLFLL